MTTPDPYEWTSKWTDPVGFGPEHDTRPSRVYIRDRGLEYLLGAPGVGTLLATCTPLACARVDAAVRVMPLPETCAPAACAKVSGTATVIVAPTPPLSPPVVEATTAVSWFAPLSMVMVWPALKPAVLATGITVASTLVAAPTEIYTLSLHDALPISGMRLGQCGGEGDAGAGDLCTGRVRRLDRKSVV